MTIRDLKEFLSRRVYNSEAESEFSQEHLKSFIKELDEVDFNLKLNNIVQKDFVRDYSYKKISKKTLFDYLNNTGFFSPAKECAIKHTQYDGLKHEKHYFDISHRSESSNTLVEGLLKSASFSYILPTGD